MKVYGRYDVVVIGGGASGACAAIAAAREGAKTLIIEKMGTIGGMLNVTGPPGWAFEHLFNNAGEQIIGGIVDELHNDLEAMDLAYPYPPQENRCKCAASYIDIDWGGLLLFEKCREAGVQMLLHSLAVDVLMEGNKCIGVVVENSDGRGAVLGEVIIEASGEGDLAVKAGVPYTKIDRTKEELDPPSITFHMDGIDWKKCTEYYKANPDQFIPDYVRGAEDDEGNRQLIERRLERLKTCESVEELVRDGVADAFDYHDLSKQALDNGDMHPYGDLGHYFTYRQNGNLQAVFQHTAQVPDCDSNSVTEVSAGEMETRRQVVIAVKAIQKYLPGYDKAYLTRMTVGMRTREGRHMIGDYIMQAEDVSAAIKFPDVMAKGCMHCMVGGPFHSVATPGTAMNTNPDRIMHEPKDLGSFDVPYRAFVPKGIEGMLLTGKLVSMSEDWKRDQLPDNMIWGQAAGVAAAVCVRTGKTPRELEADVSEVQDILRKNGAILEGTR